jgi:hypothetical protein
MSDLVTRLRRWTHCDTVPPTALMAEAASEIERLRLTDAEREAVELAVKMIGDPSPITAPQVFAYAATLRGLLERLGKK